MESLTSGTMSTEDEVEVDLEDLTWTLMEKSGFMSGIKSQILKFIQENGSLEQEFSVIPERANPVILAKIYEYLDWIGLNDTCMKLLAESPVDIEVMKALPGETVVDGEPELHKMFQSILAVSEPEVKTIVDVTKPTPMPLNDTYDITTDNKAPEDSLLRETEASNIASSNNPDGEAPISISSYEGESEKTEDISLKSTTKLNSVSPAEHLINLPQNRTAPKTSSNVISSSSEAKNRDDATPPVEKEDVSDHSDPSARLLQLLSYEEVIPIPIPPDANAIEKECEPDKDQSVMSSIAEDPSMMLSVMSFYQSTEDLSIESSVNGMSSAEHQLNFK